ncbi:MAG TPA: riboflavin synthase [Planctomycetes bacterium]|nr:riboflavin synthase [Planctomycetota bacterium]
MFTGIVECTGRVAAPCGPRGGALAVAPDAAWRDLAPGESIAVNGACLTVAAHDGGTVAFDVVPETARASNLAALAAGARVNLERALRAGDRMGGHYVLGHVDCVGRVRTLAVRGAETELRVEFPPRWGRFVLPKCSIAVNGVSLTVGEAGPAHFTVHLVPYTLRETNLAALSAGDAVNIEFDYIGKWALARGAPPGEGLNSTLRQAGFTAEDEWNT